MCYEWKLSDDKISKVISDYMERVGAVHCGYAVTGDGVGGWVGSSGGCITSEDSDLPVGKYANVSGSQ